MQVTRDSILYDGQINRYHFVYDRPKLYLDIHDYIEKTWGSLYGFATLEEEWQTYQKIQKEYQNRSEVLRIGNITSMEVIRDIQHRYVELGYYVKEANIFRVPLFGAPIYSTIALETILYSLSDKYRLSRTKYVYRLPLRDAGIQKQIRAALALGIISQVHIPENYRVWDIQEYLVRSGLPFLQFARAIYSWGEDSPERTFVIDGLSTPEELFPGEQLE